MKNIIIIILFLFAGCSRHFVQIDTSLPYEDGKVVFNINSESPNQIYIIGLSHRDTLTRANGTDTVKAEVQTYRIGEGLIQNNELELQLPEGFFSDKEISAKESLARREARFSFDAETLEKELSREDAYVNAEMLLIKSYGIVTRQVEDLNLYNAVAEKLRLLGKYERGSYEDQLQRQEFNYLQDIRTAKMLQRIPAAVEAEYRAGRIKNRKAIFTIGISHISGIIECLKHNKIEILSPAFTPYEDYVSEVEVLKSNYGITIIIPKIIADNNKLMRMHGLDE